MPIETASSMGQEGPDSRETKRYLWLLSFLYPLVALSGVAVWWAGTGELALVLPLLLGYGVAPFLDWLFGRDQANPPEEFVPQLDADPYYRRLTWATVPIHFAVLIALAAVAGTQPLSWFGILAIAVTAGLYSGLGINTGHELGHKNNRLERWLAKIVLAVPAYGHFWIEHNRGHHVQVATPEDSASSRMGESIYRFALREIPGGFRRAWALERDRLARSGRGAWSIHNEILHSYALTAVLQVGLLIVFGWVMLPFLAVHNAFAWWQLTSANYVEHYGLLRQRDASGRYERCQPWHSWNANHLASNLVMFHLERHSDHHANPTRRYQCLRDFPDVPQLPSGYFGMFLLAYFPALWFRVMDPRVMALPRVAGDLDRVNVDPAALPDLQRRWGGADGPVPA